MREILFAMRAQQFASLEEAVSFVICMEESLSSSLPSTLKSTKIRRATPGRSACRWRLTESSDDSGAEEGIRQAAILGAEGSSSGVLKSSSRADHEAEWLVDWSLDEVEVDRDGELTEDVVFKVFQTKVGASVLGKGACFYCG